MTVDASSITHDKTDKVLTLEISLPQNDGFTPISIIWTVTIRDECWDATLTAPTMSTSYPVPLWSSALISIP